MPAPRHDAVGPRAGVLTVCIALALLAGGCAPAANRTSTTSASAPTASPATATAAAKPEKPPVPKLPVPESVRIVSDLAYAEGKDGADAERNRLDLYLPAGATAAVPVVVFVHGGGYQRGDKDEDHNLGVTLARHGVAVAAISYRLAPAHPFPAHIVDVARAVAWIKANAATHGLDPHRIYLSGHSAGAHLASLAATDPQWLTAEGCTLGDLAGVLCLSGGYRVNPIRMPVFGSQAAMDAASPFAHLGGCHPPFLLVYGGDEKPERAALSTELRDGLRAVGTDAEVLCIPARDHAGLFDAIGDGDPTVTAMLDWLSRHPAK